jgi:hypothetical protein
VEDLPDAGIDGEGSYGAATQLTINLIFGLCKLDS